MIAVAVAAPFAGAVVASALWWLPSRRLVRGVLAALAAVLAFAVLPQLDPLSAVFVAIITVLSFCATLYSLSILPTTDPDLAGWSSRPAYFLLLGAFWSSMLVAVTSTTFSGVWIGISATTLATTFLVGFSGGKAALEAAWKYLMLCSFGIAIALVGILLLGGAGMSAHVPPDAALAWNALHAHAAALPPQLTRVALLLMLLGFGTKAGLVPMHSWLPDAHSKAPAPVSALLSGLLVSCSLYAIVRVQSVANLVAPNLFDMTLMTVGVLSLIVAAVLMLAQRDLKRLLSYSTIEHAGIVAIALGLATPLATFAALYHIVNHAFTKSLAFFAVGIVQQARGTTTIGKLRGLWSAPGGRLLLAALVALVGLPPFGIFISEWLVVIAAANARAWGILVGTLVGLLLAFIAIVRTAIDTQSGTAPAATTAPPRPLPALVATGAVAAIALLIALAPFVAPMIRGGAIALATVGR